MGEETQIFVLCGARAVSGGAELAHQFCNMINRMAKRKAKMCYVDLSAKIEQCIPADTEAAERYRVYKTEHVRDLTEIDLEKNVAVVPEGLTLAIDNIKKARVVVWWMSVDNYFKATGGSDLTYIRQRVGLHLVQSYYAKLFVEKEFAESKAMWMTDYIRPEHGTFLYPAEYRQDIILYNPAKGYEITQKMKGQIDWIQWIPIVGRTVEEVIVLMQASKIYVDFGNHPGRDRIPREAAANGCCVITNRKGSAKYQEDVPIPEKYKFDDPEKHIFEIDGLIRDICCNFEKSQNDFAKYRQWIHGEKERFCMEAEEFVDYIESGDLI